MSGFVAGGTVASGQVVSDPFWPAIELDQVRARLRIDGSVSTEKLKAAVIKAAISVNRELAGFRFAQVTGGYSTLAAVPGTQIDGISERAHLYLSAIDAATAAEVVERYRSYDSTATGDRIHLLALASMANTLGALTAEDVEVINAALALSFRWQKQPHEQR